MRRTLWGCLQKKKYNTQKVSSKSLVLPKTIISPPVYTYVSQWYNFFLDSIKSLFLLIFCDIQSPHLISSLRQLSFFCSCFFSFYGMHFLRNPHKRYFSNWGRCHLQKSQFHQHLTRSENPGQKTRKSVYFQNWYICMLIKGQCQTWFVFSSHE